MNPADQIDAITRRATGAVLAAAHDSMRVDDRLIGDTEGHQLIASDFLDSHQPSESGALVDPDAAQLQ